ncbi:hypothetical protein BN7_5828 [Wickerhamomyces ciferrii]|uniref:Uncharacterized protein n=1 Tax=Wickerhamomyces ciferrii (strain ATCC 14091 / BCRC 22168 / CBS 111 / JCM 3599 / NBRC 0793 / NRRL Y-1031 F-60-10) TaxID=1206466 RepID=K0KW89_WICCF|nr:uncharacterized protein BN7_5828 [Wickerhamomyces ciferrii]CCH46237.1 hypothetical protein BN7_5828 [Wickerhamomyces ciferrii]
MSTAKGRKIAGFIGGLSGLVVGIWFFTKNYELVKFTPPERNPDGSLKPKKFKVTFQPTSPLKLKPEVEAKQKQAIKEKYLSGKMTEQEKNEYEQILQEPTNY